MAFHAVIRKNKKFTQLYLTRCDFRQEKKRSMACHAVILMGKKKLRIACKAVILWIKKTQHGLPRCEFREVKKESAWLATLWF